MLMNGRIAVQTMPIDERGGQEAKLENLEPRRQDL